MDYNCFIAKYPKMRELDPMELPEDLMISTMTLVCKIPVKFNVVGIAKYLTLSDDFIQTITCGNNREIHRTLNIATRKKLKSKKKRNFYNQVTMIIKCVNVVDVNIKIFKNGSIQMTGCKKISPVIWVLDKLFGMLREKLDEYAEPYVFLTISELFKFKIAMINSNFNIGFKINRDKLYYLLADDKYDCEYDPSRHAGVKLRYNLHGATKNPSIFIFGKGSIIITGARTYAQIMECYKFINVYLIENYNKVVYAL